MDEVERHRQAAAAHRVAMRGHQKAAGTPQPDAEDAAEHARNHSNAALSLTLAHCGSDSPVGREAHQAVDAAASNSHRAAGNAHERAAMAHEQAAKDIESDGRNVHEFKDPIAYAGPRAERATNNAESFLRNLKVADPDGFRVFDSALTSLVEVHHCCQMTVVELDEMSKRIRD